MHLLELTLLVLVGHLVHGYSPGIDFIGIGYNLLKANPEGGVGRTGGVDPGLNVVRQILQLSSGAVPKEVIYQKRSSCLQVKSSQIFYGTKSYQKRLSLGLHASGKGNGEVASAAYSLSAGYNHAYSQTNKNRNVEFDDETICNLGTARFAEELSRMHNFHVTNNFVSAVCQLSRIYTTAAYMKFLDDWGTHVIMEVQFGTKVIRRYQSSLSEFINHVQKSGGAGFSVSGTYNGYGGSLAVDFNKFKASSAYKLQFGTLQSTLTSGSTSQPEPVGLTIKTIAEALDANYWQGSTVLKECGHSLGDLHLKQTNIVKALTGYAKYKLFKPPTDPQLKIPLTWPSGTYGLVKSTSGCPAGRVTWHTGMRHQGDNSVRHKNRITHVVSGGHSVTLEFCMKGDAKITEFDADWPAGDYCILKYLTCPKGFQSGSIYWDDPDTSGNTNSKSGALPDGEFNSNTRIDFCCRKDSLPTHQIMLPTEKPFTLFKYTRECQHVAGMKAIEHYMHWEDETSHNHDSVTGAHPMDTGGSNQHALHICQYSKSGSLIG